MKNPFCNLLTNQIRIEYGQLKPCCWFKESVDINDTVAIKQFLKKIESIDSWEATEGNCEECQQRESKNTFSPRLESLGSFRLNSTPENSKLSIEIQIDRDCNGACLICGPWNSTTWEKYDNKIRNIPIKNVSDVKTETSQLINSVKNIANFDSVQRVLFLGGEPFKTKSHLEFLKLISNPNQTVLKYTTNGSYRVDDEVLEVWSKFKHIQIQFSIDGIGEHFNYLRWPLPWHQVESNIEFFNSKPLPNIGISLFSYTTTPLSLFYHDRYDAWARSTFTDGEKMFSKPWQPRGNSPMDLSAIPPYLQHIIREKYGPDHRISKLLLPFDRGNYLRFISYVNYHDQHRQLEWRKIFPEVQEYFR